MQELWTALGVEPAVVEQLASHLRFTWKNGYTFVSKASLDCEGGIINHVTGALLGLWKFQRFSDSRWVTVGHSCRTLVCGLLSGMGELVYGSLADPACMSFTLTGFNKMGDQVRVFTVQAAMCSHVSDAVLITLMDDLR